MVEATGEAARSGLPYRWPSRGGSRLCIPRHMRAISSLMLWALVSMQPSCTLFGLGAGIGIGLSEPDYKEHSWPPQAKQEPHAFEQLELSRGDRVRLVLLDGTELEGKYLELEAPTASDPEMYILFAPKRENGHRPSHGKEPMHVPLGQIRTLSVAEIDANWILGCTVLGLALDVLTIVVVGNILGKPYDD